MEADMVSYMENLTAATAEKERIGAELSLANTIQLNSIPNVFPAFPDRQEFDIYATMTPAKEVGGDFYNFFLVDEDHLALVIGDVSGKGIPAALFMMVTNILLSDRTSMGGSPAVILSFIDGGRPYDPLAAGDPDVTASAEERGVGGLGVYMVKKSMDDISYEYKDGQNILRIRKNL